MAAIRQASPVDERQVRVDVSPLQREVRRDLAWFPAWVLTERAGLARWLGEAQPSRDSAPERVMRLLIELIGLERQGRHHNVIERRKALRDMHPILYGAYMKSR
jgi:hypothetical protein